MHPSPNEHQALSDTITFLKRVSLFADLDERALTVLARVSHTQRVSKGEILLRQDDLAEAAYIVRAGAIAILLTTPDGRELVINEMSPGDCFGELGLLSGQPRSASAVARTASELVVIPRVEFLLELEREPKLMQRLLGTLATRLRASAERESALAFLEAPTRLAQILLQLDRVGSVRGLVSVSQEELAQRVGVARQTIAKILGQWRRAGWLVTGRGKIVLLDRAALRRRAQEPDA